MNENSGEFSDELDEFEESIDEAKQKNLRNQTSYQNKPYDEAYEVSQDLSMAESFDGRKDHEKDRKLKNDKYDEAVEVSQSLDQSAVPKPQMTIGAGAKGGPPTGEDEKNAQAKGLSKNSEQSKSQSILNKPFDEALEFSRSGSDSSVETAHDKNQQQQQQHGGEASLDSSNKPRMQQMLGSDNKSEMAIEHPNRTPKVEHPNEPQSRPSPNVSALSPARKSGTSGDDNDSGSDDSGDHEESYENLEGAYNAKDYLSLNVTVEVRDLFQYIERYKPHEVELGAPLKCFIPEYIPAIGELDAFVKVPRPDEKEDGLGLRYLDEPSTTQSDPTVLELQLRAKSKKLQYGDVAVRSLEYAEKNPNKIDKWIADINDLHRSKPPPQVNYRKNMPDFDRLMDIWPEEFESLLSSGGVQLPSPDLDMSLGEYAKTLCTLLDIPTYDNPIESLHLMFSLYIEFRNNPHFQSRLPGGGAGGAGMDAKSDGRDGGAEKKGEYNNYGAADVLAIEQG